MIKEWEYKVIQCPVPGSDAQQLQLKNLGDLGWELVCVSEGFAYLRRQK